MSSGSKPARLMFASSSALCGSCSVSMRKCPCGVGRSQADTQHTPTKTASSKTLKGAMRCASRSFSQRRSAGGMRPLLPKSSKAAEICADRQPSNGCACTDRPVASRMLAMTTCSHGVLQRSAKGTGRRARIGLLHRTERRILAAERGAGCCAGTRRCSTPASSTRTRCWPCSPTTTSTTASPSSTSRSSTRRARGSTARSSSASTTSPTPTACCANCSRIAHGRRGLASCPAGASTTAPPCRCTTATPTATRCSSKATATRRTTRPTPFRRLALRREPDRRQSARRR